MKHLTVSLDPPYVMVGEEMYSCSLQQIRLVLLTLGCLKWPLKECFVKVQLSDADRRFDDIVRTLESKEANAEDLAA
jgi:hypothetical protein